MRPTAPILPTASLVLLTLACGPSRLEKKDAEAQIRAGYPVTVTLRIPEQAGASAGTAEALRLKGLAEALAHSGWFEASAPEVKGRVEFTARLKPGAPTTIKASGQGFQVPVAQAAFAGLQAKEERGSEARVAYLIRLEQPTALFPAFELRYPDAKAGATKQRHARFTRDGRAWKLAETDEKFGKAE